MIQRFLMIIVILAVVLGGGYYAYQQLLPPPEVAASGPVYSTQAVKRGDLAVGVEVVGQLNPSRGGGIQVPGGYGPMASGVTNYLIDQVLINAGDHVSMGQPLVRLKSLDLDLRIEALQQQIQVNRQWVADRMDVPIENVDQVDPASGMIIRTPISGRVVGLTVEEGAKVDAGVIARIVDASRFRLTAYLTPSELNQAKVGDHALLRFAQFDSPVIAVVTDINPNSFTVKSSELSSSSFSGGNGGEDFQFVYRMTLEADNPGLIQQGMEAMIGFAAKTEGEDPAGPLSAVGARWLRYNSKIEGYVQEQKIVNPTEAMATRVHVREMQPVVAGDPIVTLVGNKDYQREIETKLDKIRQDEIDLMQLQAQLGQMEVRAPMDGIVANLEKQPGQSVGPGEWFGSIYNTADMRMFGQVDDIDVLLVQQGSTVQVRVDALAGKTFAGTVEFVDTMGQDQNGITRFGVNIKVQGSVEMRPGMNARAYINAGSATGVLLVPLEGIFEEDGQSKVEILQADGATRVVPVQLGLMNDRVAEVKSGLAEGDLVVTGSTADLLPSQRIQSQDSLLPVAPAGGSGQPSPAGNSRNSGPTTPEASREGM